MEGPSAAGALFFDLTKALGALGAWVRLHYVYPYPHVDQVLPLMAEGLVLPYLDIPFQHAAPSVLKAMRRPAHREKTTERIHAWRRQVPDLAIRSTFIVGFPGETDADFEMLLAWLQDARINRAGCFKYEPVPGATANDLATLVPDNVAEERWHRFMATQQAVSRSLLAEKVGRDIDVLIDQADGNGAIGRSQWDAPEIDGNVHLHGCTAFMPGDMVRARVTRSAEYDLWAVPLAADG